MFGLFSRKTRPTRSAGRANGSARRPGLAPQIDALEGRQLLTLTAPGFVSTPLGVTAPDLAVTRAFTSPATTDLGQLAVAAEVANLATSETREPLNLGIQVPTSADAPASTLGVFANVRLPGGRSLPPLRVGSLPIPEITQNQFVRVEGIVGLGRLPLQFLRSGVLDFTVVADVDDVVAELNEANNTMAVINERPTVLGPALADLMTINFSTPEALVPGQSFFGSVTIANNGTVDAVLPFEVVVVASEDEVFDPGIDQIVQTFDVQVPLPSLSRFATPRLNLLGLTGGITPNARTFSSVFTLPDMPGDYFLGVVVDPMDQIAEIDDDAGFLPFEASRFVTVDNAGFRPTIAPLSVMPTPVAFPALPMLTRP